jgi:hypothetical protein
MPSRTASVAASGAHRSGRDVDKFEVVTRAVGRACEIAVVERIK